MNRGIKVLQTSALPLGYGAVQLLMRDPMDHGSAIYKQRIPMDPSDLKTLGTRISCPCLSGADYGDRTRHLDLGKVALYQMS